jgi:hypothetical protein
MSILPQKWKSFVHFHWLGFSLIFAIILTGIECTITTELYSRDPAYKVVAFYNIYAAGSHFEEIVADQLRTIHESSLYDQLDVLFYNTIRNQTFRLPNNEKYKLMLSLENGNEVDTLEEVHKFCKVNPKSKVLYFHDKGSFHGQKNNWRLAMDCYILNPYCISALDVHDTCGLRFTLHPFSHYSGNFWWSTCNHVNSLRAPKQFQIEVDQ